MPGGINKGYDRFIDAARLLARRNQQIRFHVVGSFDESDADIGELEGRITFYGPQYRNFFPGFHANMDIILSPNIPFALDPGVFDGFPTGCCIEAALCGVAVFCTDELAMNNGTFKDREEIVIISREPEEICGVVEEYLSRPSSLAELATKGQHAFRREYDLNKQMEPRLRVLSSLLNVKSDGGVHTRPEKHDN
jgi:glycosyltransferase involved in cell wall biosynthesis